MIPANGAPHDLEACDVLRSLSFAQRRARDNRNQIGASPNCRPSTTFSPSISMSAASWSPFASDTTPRLSAQIEDQPRRCVLTAFAIASGLGPAKAARHFDEPVSAHLLSFVHRRHMGSDSLRAAVGIL
jgi:hypothetical protein